MNCAVSSEPAKLRKTPLFDLQAEHGGSMSPWQGYEAASHYESILDEHIAAIDSMALFDLGFRGFLRLEGPSSTIFLNRLAAQNINDMPVGALWEVPFIYSDGTLADVVKIGRAEEQMWYLLFSKPNYSKLIEWIKKEKEPLSVGCWMDDLSQQYAWVGVSGVRAQEFLCLGTPSLTELRSNHLTEALIGGVLSQVLRTKDTFFEVGCQQGLLSKIVRSWWTNFEHPRLSGWASYENWQLENGMLRWGHEIKEDANPFELGLEKKIDFGKDFIGSQALAKNETEGLKQILIYFYLDAMRVPRAQAPIYCADKRVGHVCAGGYSAKLKRPIGSAWVKTEDVDFDQLQVEIRRQRFSLNIKALPF